MHVPGRDARWIAIGMVLLVGCAQDSRQPTPEFDYANPDVPGSDLIVAEVNGVPITAGFVQHKLAVQYPEMSQEGPAMALQVREILKRTIDERCFNYLAYERGYDQDPEFLRVLELSRSHILTNVSISRSITDRARVSEEELRAYYDDNPRQFRIEPQAWYHMILVESEAEAWSLHRRLREGESFGELARQASQHAASAEKDGEMPAMTPTARAGSLGNLPALWEALQELSAEEISEPIRTAHGWHILMLDAFRKESRRPFEEVKAGLGGRLTATRGSELYRAVLDSIKTAYRVYTDEEALDQFYYLQMDDAVLFDTAQREEEPEKKLAMYEQILERFPESRHCPEALFMVGFVCAEELADTTRAIDAFQHFLSQYPQHEMVSSAELMIRDLSGAAAAGEGASGR